VQYVKHKKACSTITNIAHTQVWYRKVTEIMS